MNFGTFSSSKPPLSKRIVCFILRCFVLWYIYIYDRNSLVKHCSSHLGTLWTTRFIVDSFVFPVNCQIKTAVHVRNDFYKMENVKRTNARDLHVGGNKSIVIFLFGDLNVDDRAGIPTTTNYGRSDVSRERDKCARSRAHRWFRRATIRNRVCFIAKMFIWRFVAEGTGSTGSIAPTTFGNRKQMSTDIEIWPIISFAGWRAHFHSPVGRRG